MHIHVTYKYLPITVPPKFRQM